RKYECLGSWSPSSDKNKCSGFWPPVPGSGKTTQHLTPSFRYRNSRLSSGTDTNSKFTIPNSKLFKTVLSRRPYCFRSSRHFSSYAFDVQCFTGLPVVPVPGQMIRGGIVGVVPPLT